MSDLKNVMKIIDKRKELFLIEKGDLLTKDNLIDFKIYLKNYGYESGYALLSSYMFFVLLSLTLIPTPVSTSIGSFVQYLIVSLVAPVFPSMLIMAIIELNDRVKEKMNLSYLFYKIKSKKNKNKSINKVLTSHFMLNEKIDIQTLNKIKDIIEKKGMLEFLALNKNNLTYSSLIEFLQEKEEKELIIRKQSTETLVNLVDTIYLEDKIK